MVFAIESAVVTTCYALLVIGGPIAFAWYTVRQFLSGELNDRARRLDGDE